MAELLLLEQSFGKGSGDTISLLCQSYCPPEALEDTLLGFSCYPPALPKIRTCLTISGRYDCEVQPFWFRRQAGRLEKELAALGIELQILRLSECSSKPVEHSFKGVKPVSG
jgi:hypothetical protein